MHLISEIMEEIKDAHIEVKHLRMAYNSFVVMRDISFKVKRGEIFFIVGGSGCGKTTLLKHMIGLLKPVSGDVIYDGKSGLGADGLKENMLHKFGVLYQAGALWTSMTLLENIALPLEQHTNLSEDEINEIASVKLSLVGLRGFENFYPAELSGGMRKRAGLARAMALDPEILFFDEPSSGLDPVNARRLDDLIVLLRNILGTTVVVVSHDLASIMSIADRLIYLDAEAKDIIAEGTPKDLMENSKDPRIIEFFTRGESTKWKS